MTIEKKKPTESLVLRRSANAPFDRQMRQKRIDLGFGHVRRVPNIVKDNETLHPHHVGSFRSAAVMATAERQSKTVEKPRLGIRSAVANYDKVLVNGCRCASLRGLDRAESRAVSCCHD